MSEIATVKIQADNELGYAVINQSDFDSDTMQNYCETGECLLPKAEAFVSSELPIGEAEITLVDAEADHSPETVPADNSDQRTLVDGDAEPVNKKAPRAIKKPL